MDKLWKCTHEYARVYPPYNVDSQGIHNSIFMNGGHVARAFIRYLDSNHQCERVVGVGRAV